MSNVLKNAAFFSGDTVPEPGCFAQFTANQTLRHQSLQPRKGLFTRQPGKEMGEPVSEPLTPQRPGA